MNFETIIGLEVHVELKTNSKVFSPSPIGFGDEPNSNISHADLGYTGTLPVLNEQAVDFAMKAAMALNMEIATDTIFDRKSYYYPDNPKAYQISQDKQPIGEHGWIDIEVEGKKKDRKSTRLNSSHVAISYAVFCLKKKKKQKSDMISLIKQAH